MLLVHGPAIAVVGGRCVVVPGRSGPVGRLVVVAARGRAVVRRHVDSPLARVVVAVVRNHDGSDRPVATTEQHGQDEQDGEAITLH